MYPNKPNNHSRTIDPLLFEMMVPNVVEIQRHIEHSSHDDTDVVIDSDNEEDLTSSCISGIEEDEDDDTKEQQQQQRQQENIFQGTIIHQGNLLHGSIEKMSLNQLLNVAQSVEQHFSCHFRLNSIQSCRSQLTMIQPHSLLRTIVTNTSQRPNKSMADLAAEHRHSRTSQSIPSESEILSFIGPCPLYSLESSFGLDMCHGLSNFPCQNTNVGGSGHPSAPPLWQHLTSFHNLNFSSTSQILRYLLLHGYSIPTEKFFTIDHQRTILRTTPRHVLIKACPLTRYGVYGIRFEHGARLCSGFTLNSNIYTHLISFHQMTDQAALKLSRAIAFHEKNCQFHPSEIIVRQPKKVVAIQHRISKKKRLKKKNPVKKRSN